MSGDTDIAPLHVWDDGTFTHFKFAEHLDLPVIYMADGDGQESMVDRHSMGEDSTIVVVHKVHDRWILRLGDRALAIYNEAHGKKPRLEPPQQPSTGTSAPSVQRVIKPSAGPRETPSMSKKEHPINVAAEIAKRDQPMGGVRDTTALNSAQSRFMPGARLFLAGITGISVLLGGVMLYKVYQTKSAPQAEASPTATVRNTLPALKTTTGHETAPQPSETISSPPPALPPVSRSTPDGNHKHGIKRALSRRDPKATAFVVKPYGGRRSSVSSNPRRLLFFFIFSRRR